MNAEAKAEILEIFNAAQAEGLDKNQTIMKLAMDGGLPVMEAVREYQAMARNAGLVLGTKERYEKTKELLDTVDISDPEVRLEMAVRLAEEFDTSEATAKADIAKYAKEKGIELPSVQRNSREEVIAFVKQQHVEGKSRAEIVEALQNDWGYTHNSANSSCSSAFRELGLTSGRGSNVTVPLPELVKLIREHDGMQRKDLAKLIHEETGYSEVTAAAFLTYVNFAKEWARQEVEQTSKPTASAA